MHIPVKASPPAEKAQRYATLRAEIAAVIEGEPNRIARYASAASLLAQAFADRFFWTGFYLVDADKPEELVVGPYQGTLGCLRIAFGKGVLVVSTSTVEHLLARRSGGRFDVPPGQLQRPTAAPGGLQRYVVPAMVSGLRRVVGAAQ